MIFIGLYNRIIAHQNYIKSVFARIRHVASAFTHYISPGQLSLVQQSNPLNPFDFFLLALFLDTACNLSNETEEYYF